MERHTPTDNSEDCTPRRTQPTILISRLLRMRINEIKREIIFFYNFPFLNNYIILLINNLRVQIINLTVIPIQPNCSSVQKELKSVPVALKGSIASPRNCG